MEVRVSDGTGNTVTVEGNCAALASIGPANHFRVVAPALRERLPGRAGL
ncbi:MAG TPA: hypothetical protein PLF37_14445 [Planctomycetota bacterium]|nr:hypothetical protein [Planctomycetota bacterium]